MFGNMVLYVAIMQALDNAKDQRACIDSALILDPFNVASCDEPHRLRQCKLLCNFYTSSPDCNVQDC